MHHSTTTRHAGFWRHFDRWALLLVVALQAAIWVSRHGQARSDALDDGPASAEAPRQVPSGAAPAVARPLRRLAAEASPVCFRHSESMRAPLSVDSVRSMAAWDVLRRSPALDVREVADGYELRLSVPGGAGPDARTWVEDRLVEIEVPLFDASGRPSGRLVRQVLLPSAPAAAPPHLEHTNGILRVFLPKPPR